jgi:hypothetical protein
VSFAAMGEARLRLPVLATIGVTLGAGALFWWHNLERVAEALENVDPSMRITLEEVGRRESARPIQLAVGAAVLAAIIAGVGELQRRRDG